MRYQWNAYYFAAAILLAASGVEASNNGQVLTPPRGFSTWNAYSYIGIDEATCYRYMNALVKRGLNKLNYTYFIVDEPCFTGRDASGALIENKTTWPHGLKAFGASLREHGMKLGTYTCVGPKTCGGCIASEGHEDQDVATFASWGVEYLKVDSCSRNCTAAAGIPGGNKTVCGETLWSRYAAAMKRHKTVAGEEMLYSIIGNLAPGRNGGNPPWKWGASIANSWRTNIDVQNGYSFLHYIVDAERRLSGNGSWCPTDSRDPNGAGFPCADGITCHTNSQCPGPQAFSGPGHWNDMDMLIIGTATNFKPPFCPTMTPPPGSACVKPRAWDNMTLAQSRSQMSMWTILKSPLLISADLTDTSPSTVAFVDILANPEVLAVHDDPLGNEARRLGDSGYHGDQSVGEIYVSAMANGAHAVVMFNRNSAPIRMTLEITDVCGQSSKSVKHFTVRDVWTHTNNGTVSCDGSVTAMVGGDDVVMILLRTV